MQQVKIDTNFFFLGFSFDLFSFFAKVAFFAYIFKKKQPPPSPSETSSFWSYFLSPTVTQAPSSLSTSPSAALSDGKTALNASPSDLKNSSLPTTQSPSTKEKPEKEEKAKDLIQFDEEEERKKQEAEAERKRREAEEERKRKQEEEERKKKLYQLMVVKCQAMYRGHIIRKAVNLPQLIANSRKRKKVAEELLITV